MSSEPERRNVTIRRAPKVIPFLVIGAFLGLIAAWIIAFTGQEGSDFSRGTVLGFFSALLLIPGLLLGALAALFFDWVSVRRSRNAVVESTEDDTAAVSQSAGVDPNDGEQTSGTPIDSDDSMDGSGLPGQSTDDGPRPGQPRQ